MNYKLAYATLEQEISNRKDAIHETQKEVEEHLNEIVSKKNLIKRLKPQIGALKLH